jgi:hypothetical protein
MKVAFSITGTAIKPGALNVDMLAKQNKEPLPIDLVTKMQIILSEFKINQDNFFWRGGGEISFHFCSISNNKRLT